jgi:hypothetical protein
MKALNTWPLRAILLVIALAGAALPATAQTARADERAINKVLQATWGAGPQRLEVGPVVIVSEHALAGWTQGPRGGRALLSRSKPGEWAVAVCGGDGLKDAKVLEQAGISPADARGLAAALAKADAALPAERRAKFSTFDGVVRMDASGNHPPAHKH